MIVTMAYLMLIAALLGLAAYVGERICAALGWPRRAVWLGALVASLALPAAAYFSAASSTQAVTATGATPILSLPPLLDQIPVIGNDRAAAGGGTGGAPASRFNWPDWRAFEASLTGLWAASSAALLLMYLFAGLRLHHSARTGPSLKIGSQTVWLSDRFGPAVLGFLRPRIVLPRWLAEGDTALRSQVLQHEREHIAAHDQLALLAALLLVAGMPWNIALWWQLRRLRTAIEFDCDSRVLRTGADPSEYSQALLLVGQHAPRTPFAAVALTEPMSELERRIRTVLDRARGIGVAGIAACSAMAVTLLATACAVNAPSARPPVRPEITSRLNEALDCMMPTPTRDTDCAHRILDEMRAMPGLNVPETAELLYYSAALSQVEDDPDAAMTAYASILDLPSDRLPDFRAESASRGLINMAQQQGRYQDALDAYDRLLARPSHTPTEQDYYSRAILLYRLGNYSAALAETAKANTMAERPREATYELEYVLQWLSGDEAGASSTLEFLETHWPNEQRASPAGALTLAQSTIGDFTRNVGAFRLSGDYLPAVHPDPIYPPRALARDLEGYVDLRYTVTATGNTADVRVVGSSSTLFERSAIEAVLQYEYSPREVDGAPVEVEDVTAKIEYLIADNG